MLTQHVNVINFTKSITEFLQAPHNRGIFVLLVSQIGFSL